MASTKSNAHPPPPTPEKPPQTLTLTLTLILCGGLFCFFSWHRYTYGKCWYRAVLTYKSTGNRKGCCRENAIRISFSLILYAISMAQINFILVMILLINQRYSESKKIRHVNYAYTKKTQKISKDQKSCLIKKLKKTK